MKILSVECSATPASVAVLENGKILANSFLNAGLTHSQTLMPMIKSTMATANVKLTDIDALAVASGPGSFTGIRIGIAAVKGLATPKNMPCIGVSTLEGMAYCHLKENGILCCVMDARCSQVYNALFRVQGGKIERLTPDRALLCEELASELELQYENENVIIVGDGARVFSPYFPKGLVPEADNVFQNALGVAYAAEQHLEDKANPENLMPVYLRLPQAERELNKKREVKSI